MSIIKQALISVSDKTGIVDFCRQLVDLDITILSTGGTASLLEENNIPVTEVSDYTGFPEIMDGRVKTLHPRVHGGLLGRAGQDDTVMKEHGIDPIGLVVVNLYPFEQTVSKPDCTMAEAIENIDIGGPSMLRAAAKNHARVGVIVDVNDYDSVIEEIKTNGGKLAKGVFSHGQLRCQRCQLPEFIYPRRKTTGLPANLFNPVHKTSGPSLWRKSAPERRVLCTTGSSIRHPGCSKAVAGQGVVL